MTSLVQRDLGPPRKRESTSSNASSYLMLLNSLATDLDCMLSELCTTPNSYERQRSGRVHCTLSTDRRVACRLSLASNASPDADLARGLLLLSRTSRVTELERGEIGGCVSRLFEAGPRGVRHVGPLRRRAWRLRL
ncbi:unnamed protein product [Xylocopa violacea]|uniref:Uncharacterized protein n=1 Tax=Xylocopa violacea TaxID=135666 RepID=A0ABP1NEQ0_XYLVO